MHTHTHTHTHARAHAHTHTHKIAEHVLMREIQARSQAFYRALDLLHQLYGQVSSHHTLHPALHTLHPSCYTYTLSRARDLVSTSSKER